MFSMRRDRSKSWLYVGSAMLGGLFLGMSYNKYGRDIKHQLNRIKNKGMSSMANMDLD